MTTNTTMTETEKTVLRILEKIELGDLSCSLSDGIIKVLINGVDLWIGYANININGVIIPTNNKDIMNMVSAILRNMYDKRNIDSLTCINKILDDLESDRKKSLKTSMQEVAETANKLASDKSLSDAFAELMDEQEKIIRRTEREMFKKIEDMMSNPNKMREFAKELINHADEIEGIAIGKVVNSL